MAFTLPNPTVPTNGQSLDATPLLANLVAIAQAIASFDGSQIQSASIVAAAFNASINPNTLLNETTYSFIASGLVWTGDSYGSTLAGSMTSGVLYYNGVRVTVNSVSGHTFTASKDTYIDIDKNANITYVEATNNAASPALTANSIRVAIVVSGANIAAATSINQGQETLVLPIASSIPYQVTDSLGNLICPRDPNHRLIGYRQITGAVTLTTPTAAAAITGLTVPIIIPTGRRIKVSIDGGLSIQNSGSNVSSFGICLTSASDVNRVKQLNIAAAVSGGAPSYTDYTTTLTGSQTFVAYLRAATGNVTCNADPISPAFIKVELI